MDIGRLQQFFNQLGPRLEMAREMDARLNRQLALRFNVLDYIRTSELGLSKVMADLLNPQATHDQGVLFLEVFLGLLRESSERGGKTLRVTESQRDEWQIDPKTVVVRRERPIDDGRLDVSVEFSSAAGEKQCLAIENKPYAGDGEGQVEKYLNFLSKEYPGNHSLLYVSSDGEPPGSESLCPDRCRDERDRGQFAVMAYSGREAIDEGGSDEDESDNTRSGTRLDRTLADWLRNCRRATDVDRLRVFLHDAAQFCDRHFGGGMTNDNLFEMAIDFIRRDKKHAEVAQLVERVVPKLRDRVHEGIWDQVRKELKNHRPPKWNLKEHRGRLRLHKEGHGADYEFSGVWLQKKGFHVGIEWPREPEASPDESIRRCFGVDKIDVGQRQGGGGGRARLTWYIAGQLKGDKWAEWDCPLVMTDPQIRQFAEATSALMRRLAEVFDRGDET